MMTTRRLEELPAADAEPIFDVLQRARTAATLDVDDVEAWAAAEAGQQPVRTGYKAARRVASAGQYAAHALRLQAARSGPHEPWQQALTAPRTAAALDSWDWDERMYAALDLRATFKDLEREARAGARPAQLVAAWLTHNGGPQLPAATARLCAYALEHVDDALLGDAWYATHGLRLLRELAAPPSRGQAPAADAPRRARLRLAVQRTAASTDTTKVELAAAAGITRPTLDAWLAATNPSSQGGSAGG